MRSGIRSRTAPLSRGFSDGTARSGIPKMLDMAFRVRAPSRDPRLDGSGLVVVNPPFTFEKEMRVVLPELKESAGRGSAAPAGRWIGSPERTRRLTATAGLFRTAGWPQPKEARHEPLRPTRPCRADRPWQPPLARRRHASGRSRQPMSSDSGVCAESLGARQDHQPVPLSGDARAESARMCAITDFQRHPRASLPAGAAKTGRSAGAIAARRSSFPTATTATSGT